PRAGCGRCRAGYTSHVVAFKQSFRDQLAPEFDPIIGVRGKDSDGSAPNTGPAHNLRTTPAKMPSPYLASGVKEQHDRARARIDARQIGPLVSVALAARETQIVEIVFAA